MSDESLPRYIFRPDDPGLLEMARAGLSDVASVIPARILAEPAVQLPSPRVGPRSPLVVADPDLARLVLVDKAGQFGRDRLMQRLMRRSWGKGLAAAEGATWHSQRSAAQGFFRTSTLKTQIEPFRDAAAQVLRSVEDGETLELQHLSGRIIARILLSVLVNAGGAEEPDALSRLLPDYMRAISGFSFIDLMRLPEAMHDFFAGISRSPAANAVHSVADRIAKARVDGEPRQDLIDYLQARGPIEDNIRGLIPAAMDTTVKGLTWTLYLLARYPALQEEVARMPADGIPARDSCIGQVVQESLRLYPPASFLVRTAMEGTEIGGFPVRKGQTIAVAIYAMHRHSALWERPDDFQPERFGPGESMPRAYIPFGLGPRSCIAAQFALTEIMVIAMEICRRFKLEASGHRPEVGLQVTTHPVGPIALVAHKRQNT